MKPNLNTIEIQEPPLEKITKKRSCLKQGCWSGCGCLIFIFILLIFLLKFVATSKPRGVESVPEHIKNMIHIYDEDNIDSITYLSGERRQKSMRILTYVPRLLLVPVITLLDIDIPQEKTGEPSDQNPWQRAYSFVNNREIDARDVITIKWQHLSAEPSFIEAFYRTEFRKASFSTENASTENEQGLLFHKGPVDGTLRITDRPEIDGTDLLVLTIHLPHEK